MGALTRRSACIQPHQNSQGMVILAVTSQLVEHNISTSFRLHLPAMLVLSEAKTIYWKFYRGIFPFTTVSASFNTRTREERKYSENASFNVVKLTMDQLAL